MMELKLFLARWIYRKMSHNYTQASKEKNACYRISLDTIVEGAGISIYDSLPNTVRRIVKALESLKDAGIIEGHGIQYHKKGRKHVNAIFRLYPSNSQIADTIKANTTKKSLRSEGFKNLLELIK